jgi:hypothetical protein
VEFVARAPTPVAVLLLPVVLVAKAELPTAIFEVMLLLPPLLKDNPFI